MSSALWANSLPSEPPGSQIYERYVEFVTFQSDRVVLNFILSIINA